MTFMEEAIPFEVDGEYYSISYSPYANVWFMDHWYDPERTQWHHFYTAQVRDNTVVWTSGSGHSGIKKVRQAAEKLILRVHRIRLFL
jgi:hypothetical protein